MAHYASTRLDPGPRNGHQSFPAHSALDYVRQGSVSNGGTRGVRLDLPPNYRYDYTPALRQNEIFLTTMNEVMDDMKLNV